MSTKKIIIGLVLALPALLFLNSCKEDELDTYSGETNIYFSLKRWASGANGLSYEITDFPVGGGLYSGEWKTIRSASEGILVSLALDGTDVGEHVALIPVSISGNTADYDRDIAFTIDNQLTTAVQGVHFSAEGHIPAGKRIGAIAVRLNRAAIKDTTLLVGFNLVSNEHFQTNYRVINRSSSDTTKVDMLAFGLAATSDLAPPVRWETNYKNYLGDFSRKKLFLLIEITGASIEDFYDGAPSVALVTAWGKLLKNYLIEQKELGNTIYEEDGVTEMSAGRSV